MPINISSINSTCPHFNIGILSSEEASKKVMTTMAMQKITSSSRVESSLESTLNPLASNEQKCWLSEGDKPLNRAYFKISEILNVFFPMWNWQLCKSLTAIDLGKNSTLRDMERSTL